MDFTLLQASYNLKLKIIIYSKLSIIRGMGWRGNQRINEFRGEIAKYKLKRKCYKYILIKIT